LKHKCSKANYITKGKITEVRHIKQKVLAIALSLRADVKLFQTKMQQVPLTQLNRFRTVWIEGKQKEKNRAKHNSKC